VRLSTDFPSRVRCKHPFDATAHEIVIVGNQDTKRFHFALPRAGVGVAISQDTAHSWLPTMGRGQPSIRFVMNNAVPFVFNDRAAGCAVAPPHFMKDIPGLAHIEAEQPADEFVYE
jgi:hypothetical protein